MQWVTGFGDAGIHPRTVLRPVARLLGTQEAHLPGGPPIIPRATAVDPRLKVVKWADLGKNRSF